MKKVFYITLFLIINFIGHTQIINIPDPAFKTKLLEANGALNNIAIDLNGNTITIDTNNNFEIEQSEALEVYTLIVPNCNIHNLIGIEYFTNLKILQFAYNFISTVNLSNLIHLENLSCYNNQLISLSLSDLNNLRNLGCSNNLLTTLDFTNKPLLEKVFCNNNQLSSLDFSNNPLFNELDCKNNPNLTSIKIKNGYQQLFGIQTLYNQCWTGCPSLNHICADSFEIPALQADLASCGINTAGITIDSNCALGVEEYGMNSVGVFPNPSDGNFTVYFKHEVTPNTNLEIYNLLGQIIYKNSINDVKEYPIELNYLTKGTYLLKIVSGDITSNIKISIK